MNVLPLTSKKHKNNVNKITNDFSTTKTSHLLDIEKVIDYNTVSKCRISTKGKIKFCNDDFAKSFGYSKNELLEMEINSIIHPEMPKIIKLVIQNNLNLKKEILSIVKNKSKDNCYFWTASNYLPNTNLSNLTIDHTIVSKPISNIAKKEISKLYSILYKIEQNLDVVAASKYLIGFLEQKNMCYSEYIKSLLD
jgi:PAS domain S-box-containing protein